MQLAKCKSPSRANRKKKQNPIVLCVRDSVISVSCHFFSLSLKHIFFRIISDTIARFTPTFANVVSLKIKNLCSFYFSRW
jgi:hypothetical protein